MEHFSGCEVSVTVVEIAARRGLMDILRSLLEHDAGRRDKDTGSGDISSDHDGGNVVRWGGHSLLIAAQKKRYDVIQFLYENGLHSHGIKLESAIATILNAGEMELAGLLMPFGKSVKDYGHLSSNPVVIECRFAAGLLDTDVEAAAAAVNRLVPSGRLDLMKKIWEKHDHLTATDGWMRDWMRAMSRACHIGDLAILRWMVEHPSGRAVIADVDEKKISSLLYYAAYEGHLEVVQYLHEQEVAVDYGNALLCAIRRDNLDAVKYLVEHFSPSENIPEYCVLVEAARYGRVKMLQYFQRSGELQVPGFPGSKPCAAPEPEFNNLYRSRILEIGLNPYPGAKFISIEASWRPTDAMDDAAANGQLEAVKWLHLNRAERCTAKAMDEAAANGHLEVMKWLHANRSEGYTHEAIYYAAGVYNRTAVVKWLMPQSPKWPDFALGLGACGDLALAQWLHTKANARCTAKAMIRAVSHGCVKTLKFLNAHGPEGIGLEHCDIAVEIAMRMGHLRVAHWYLEHFPARCPNVDNIPALNSFESLLLLRRYYPEVFTAQWAAAIRERVRPLAPAALRCILQWLDSEVSSS